ncbi:hypothetical protein Cantr_01412 [Candida viswanathii]|uniref:Uncharacterized protein n=1 Tax=Candida viswanathii TaxID=5486 RepID=A0A367YHZ7_9ASCO|nr:hypothetical protein Cantr_01412 [Candida viswanathii]
MSASNSNPLLVDPSIVTISDKDSTTTINNQSTASQPTTTRTSSIHSLDPSNALSKLLDSAIAHAARESTPEFANDGSSINRSDGAIEEEETDEVSDERFLSTIPLAKQGREGIYSIAHLLSLRGQVEVIDVSGKLPEKAFWRLSKARTPNESTQSSSSSYRKKGRRGGGGGGGTNYNETWERKNSNSSGSGRNHNGALGFGKSHELDQLSNDKISQLLGEQENELETPEWDDIGLSGADNGMNMGQTVEDFEKWKYQMKLEERKKNGEMIDEELELRNNTNAAAVNAGNEVDNFFSFVKQDESEQTKPLESEELETSTNEDKPHRSSRFSSFFHQPKLPASPAENPVKPQQSSAQSTPTGPPPGFSKFFGGQPQPPPPQQQQPIPQPPTHHHQQPPQQPGVPPPPHILQRHGSSVSSQGSIPPGPPAASSNDNFFMSLLQKKEAEQQSPSSTKSTPSTNKDLASTGRKLTAEELQQLPRQQQQQQPPPHMQQMPPQFPPQGIPPNQLPPWMRGGPPPPGALPPHLQGKGFPQPPPGFVPQQGQPNSQPRQGGQQQGQQGQQQQQQQQGGQQQGQPRGPPPPGMFPPGYMPGPPGSSNFMPPPMPQQFMNNPNARFIPPQYMGMPLPPHMANPGQQQQQQQQRQQQAQQQPDQATH